MDVSTLQSNLDGLPIPQLRFFDVIGSTNDEGLAWAAAGAPDGSLVVADQQTKGRGRLGRRWVTRPGAALAFSLVLRPTPTELAALGFFSPLGALAICQALHNTFGLDAHIKWPNDVLLQRRKAAGILVESAWLGDQLQAVVLGMGLNVRPDAVPPASELLFPATSVAEAAGLADIDRWALLREVLRALFAWRAQIYTPAFHAAWQERLAFRGEWVRIEAAGGPPDRPPLTGQVQGIDQAGNLLLRAPDGRLHAVAVGDVHLRLESAP